MGNFALGLLFLILNAVPAFGHPGHGVSGLLHGFFHPIQGLDHLLAAFSVGLWGAQLGGRVRLGLPLTFTMGVVLGGLLGLGGIHLPFHEQGIFFSLVIFGLALSVPFRVSKLWAAIAVALFGACHGNAHALEMTPGILAVSYSVGFVSMTALIHLFGIVTLAGLRRCLRPSYVVVCTRALGIGVLTASVIS